MAWTNAKRASHGRGYRGTFESEERGLRKPPENLSHILVEPRNKKQGRAVLSGLLRPVLLISTLFGPFAAGNVCITSILRTAVSLSSVHHIMIPPVAGKVSLKKTNEVLELLLDTPHRPHHRKIWFVVAPYCRHSLWSFFSNAPEPQVLNSTCHTDSMMLLGISISQSSNNLDRPLNSGLQSRTPRDSIVLSVWPQFATHSSSAI